MTYFKLRRHTLSRHHTLSIYVAILGRKVLSEEGVRGKERKRERERERERGRERERKMDGETDGDEIYR